MFRPSPWKCVKTKKYRFPKYTSALAFFNSFFLQKMDFGHNEKTAVSSFLLSGTALLWIRVIFLVTEVPFPSEVGITQNSAFRQIYLKRLLFVKIAEKGLHFFFSQSPPQKKKKTQNFWDISWNFWSNKVPWGHPGAICSTMETQRELDADIILVSLCRTGILLSLFHIFSKSKAFVFPNLIRWPCFFNWSLLITSLGPQKMSRS